MFRRGFQYLHLPGLNVLRRKSTKRFTAYRPLEKDEISRIKHSWSIVQERDCQFMEILYEDMITNLKMYEIYFAPLMKRDQCVSEHPSFVNHPRHVFNMMDCIVLDLENENIILTKMQEIGERHKRLRINRKHINFMTTRIYQAVETVVGQCAYDPCTDASWEKFLTGFNDIVGTTATFGARCD